LDIWDLLNPTAFLIAALVFVPLERIASLRKSQKILRKHWKNDLVFVVINKIIIKLSMISIFGLFLTTTYQFIPSFIHESILTQPLWLQIIEITIISDTCYYVAHRSFHEIPVLWRFHSIHHSVEEMDWVAAHRIHPVDQIIAQAASLLPVFALGFSGPAIIIYAFIFRWQTLLIHSNTKISFGPLKWIFASPQFHHWHHGDQPEAYNKNYAAQLPFIDMLFGTFHLPGNKMPEKYGIEEKLPTLYHQQLIYPFLKKSKTERTAAELSNQIRM
jgi:sterol desaturase/sphingolipid hydroxylase (fatty acid hydroxylase superfamily)